MMLQSLIEDRFQLKAHLEPREVPVFEMVVGKDGLKIKPTADQTPINPIGPPPPALCGPPAQAPPAPRTVPFDPTKMRGFLSMQYTGSLVTATANAVELGTLMALLRQEMGRPIVDKTNHSELYDFKLQFSRQRTTPDIDANTQPAATDPGASITTALQEQLGVKLESSKGQTEVLIVESAQKPKEN